ncbi:MAG: cell division protein SepF [Acutalibacteraceae bacterium]
MAGLVDKFKRMWDVPEDDYDYDDDDYDYEDYDDKEEDLNDYSTSRSGSSSYSSSSSSFSSSYPSYSSSSAGEPRKNKVVNISATAKLQVVLFKPETFGAETKAIADELIKSHTVVLNLENTNRDVSRRILDFLSGCAYANNGSVKRIATSTFLIIPNNVDLTGDELLDELENNGLYF